MIRYDALAYRFFHNFFTTCLSIYALHPNLSDGVHRVKHDATPDMHISAHISIIGKAINFETIILLRCDFCRLVVQQLLRI